MIDLTFGLLDPSKNVNITSTASDARIVIKQNKDNTIITRGIGNKISIGNGLDHFIYKGIGDTLIIKDFSPKIILKPYR